MDACGPARHRTGGCRANHGRHRLGSWPCRRRDQRDNAAEENHFSSADDARRGHTKGGISIPDSAQEKPSQGEIIAVGPGGRDENGKLIPIDVHAGDRVLFGKWSGTEVKIDGDDLLIMKESDILGVVG